MLEKVMNDHYGSLIYLCAPEFIFHIYTAKYINVTEYGEYVQILVHFI